MAPVVFALLGLLLGAALDRHGGWAYGALAGLALGLGLSLRKRLKELEKEVALLRAERVSSVAAEAKPVEPAETASAAAPEVDPDKPFIEQWGEPEEVAESPPAPPPAPAEPAEPGMLHKLAGQARDWLLGGNIMVRVGVVVLFFGVAFLLKFAADNSILPIELRLAGVAVGGIAMLLLGWRLRDSKRLYGLVLQGGAVGVLYLTVFAALRLYELVPPTLAFGVLAAFAAFSAILAVLQDARVLAVIGVAGGFLAPILTSTGEGSHVHLFAYYLVLNLGILGIAWFKAWRVLNLVGFGFSFVIASAWGYQYYQPHFFAGTEPFLIALVLMYVAITILFAFRQPPQLRGYVDASLVFGVPLAAFAMQAGLVRGMEGYLAWSALSAAAFYVLLAMALFKRLGADSRLLAEAFLAIGVVFATLSVPLALDARWTAGMWALEGAAMVWVGGRQGQLLVRAFGYLLQLGAGLAFYDAAQHIPSGLPVMNGIFVGALLIGLAGLFSAWHIQRRDEPGWEQRLHRLFFVWGLLWWYGAWLFEISEQLWRDEDISLALAALFIGSALPAEELKRRLPWSDLKYPARFMLPALFLLLVPAFFIWDHPFEDYMGLVWLAGLAVHLRILQGEAELTKPVQVMHHAGVWLLLILLSWMTAWWLDDAVRGADTWWRMALGLVPAAGSYLLLRHADRLPWPVSAYPDLYRHQVPVPLAFYLWLWVMVLCLGSKGAADPLDYLPLLNPMDLSVALVLLLLLYWLLPVDEDGGRGWRYPQAPWALALSVFVWLNSAWFRTAHHWLGVPFDADAMFDSQTVQTGLAVLWGLIGLGGMLLGSRMGQRKLWFAGAALMAAVVAKLFLVDLSSTGTMERIVSFLSVGGLLLVVGYFSPIPPKQAEVEEQA